MYELERSGQDGSSSPSSSPSSVCSFTNQTAKQSVHSHASTMSLVHAETRMVGRIKALVLLVIAIAAATCGVMTYVFVKISEYQEFKVQFGDYATEIADLTHQEAYSMIKAMKGLSSTVTSMALAVGATFPNVTVPHFSRHGKMNNIVSKATHVTFVPLVKKEDRLAWEAYTQENQAWIQESLNETETSVLVFSIPKRIHANAKHLNGDSLVPLDPTSEGIEDDAPWYAPVWQQAPARRDASIVNFNLLAHPTFARLLHGVRENRQPALSEAVELDFLYGDTADDNIRHPHSIFMQPIYPTMIDHHERDDMAAVLIATVTWSSFLSNILHDGANGVVVVLHDSCGDHFTYRLDGANAKYLGKGDLHDHKYDTLVQETPFAPLLNQGAQNGALDKGCQYDLRIYPTEDLEHHYTTNQPFWFAFVVVLIFCCTAIVFLLFDCAVAIRQQRIMAKAKRTQAIVAALFPSQVRDRLMSQPDVQVQVARDANEGKSVRSLVSSKAQHYDFLGRGSSVYEDLHKTKPIADLYPNATVMFADIVGFTAWSSTREPTQVFTLLETLYHAFDEIVRRRRVFKVETIGDCYVAVAGLPEPRPDHALVMSRFARDCLAKVDTLTKELETTLGPDTADLSMRVGLHSGPVTAGVLRGDKARFQLFGDTVNTAARMESTGERNRIHCSHETATLIEEAGKNWTHKREDLVVAKGKGELQTYWIESTKGAHSDPSRSVTSGDGHSTDSAHEGSPEHTPNGRDMQDSKEQPVDKTQRLVDWNTDVVCRFLKQVVVHQQVRGVDETHKDDVDLKRNDLIVAEAEEITLEDSKVVLDPVVVAQVRSYIATIASLHQDHAFHNFEHASHVMMSVTKLLSCLTGVVPSNKESSDNHMHGRIDLDPLSHFACVFAALIHDMHHPGGVPGEPLLQQQSEVAVNRAWDVLMQPEYVELRHVLDYDDDKLGDLKRFRELVVAAVEAAHSFDRGLSFQTLSRPPINVATSADDAAEGTASLVADLTSHEPQHRLPTLVLVEHVMQAAVASHAMQHWQIYCKWNERRFRDSMTVFQQGRCEINPADAFYCNELDFLDHCAIPLAEKLKVSRVFGAVSDELVAYALQNRHEWQVRGRDEVLRMVEKHRGTTSVSRMTATTATIVADATRDHAIQPQQVSEENSAPKEPEQPVLTEQASDAASWESSVSDETNASFNGQRNDATLISI